MPLAPGPIASYIPPMRGFLFVLLLIAMVGAIVLTLEHRRHVKRQDISNQNARTKATAIEIVKVRPGQGL